MCVCVCVWGLNGQWSVTDRQALTLWGPLCPPAMLSSDRQRGRKTVTDTEKWLFFKLAACVPRLWIPLRRWERGGGGGWMRRWRDQRTKRKKNWKKLPNIEGKYLKNVPRTASSINQWVWNLHIWLVKLCKSLIEHLLTTGLWVFVHW